MVAFLTVKATISFAGGVAFTFDDGYKSLSTIVLPLFQERYIPATAFISTGLLGDSNYLTKTDLNQFVDAGWELGTHSIDHKDMSKMDIRDLRDNLFEPLVELKKLTEYDVISFASPFGSYNDQVLISTPRYYKTHSNAWSDTNGSNYWGSLNRYNINRWTIRISDTSADVCKRISELADDEIFVIAFHDIVLENSGREYDVTIDTLRDILDCSIKYKIFYFRIRDIIGE